MEEDRVVKSNKTLVLCFDGTAAEYDGDVCFPSIHDDDNTLFINIKPLFLRTPTFLSSSLFSRKTITENNYVTTNPVSELTLIPESSPRFSHGQQRYWMKPLLGI